ncbi:quinol:cytochrome C oxidoreductase [bacterium]|nr:quinol:cytochrome C oxidoreductase [bacterium]
MSSNHAKTVSPSEIVLPATHWLRKLPVVGIALGVICLVAALGMSLGNSEKIEVLQWSFHTSYLYFLSLALGCLFFVLVQFATRAGWSVVVRRFAETYAATLPLFAVLFLPMLFGFHSLFHHWTSAEAKEDPIIQAKSAFLNEQFFTVRGIVYVVLWSVLGIYYYRNSVRQDESGDKSVTFKLQKASYPSIALFALSVTFCAFDWIMSLNPHFATTMFGVYYFAGCIMSVYALMLLTTLSVRGGSKMGNYITIEHIHDLGKLMFGFNVFWTYIAFSQYFLIWYGNIPEETEFYARRSIAEFGGDKWLPLGIALMVGHFVVPFLLLMSRHIKRNPKLIGIGAAWMLIIHYVDIRWLVRPNWESELNQFGLFDVLTLVGIGGLFLGTATLLMSRKSLLPQKDPRLAESLAFENM